MTELQLKIKYSYKKSSPRSIKCEYENPQNFDLHFYILRTPWGSTNYRWNITDDDSSTGGKWGMVKKVRPKNPATTLSVWKRIPKNGKISKSFKLGKKEYILPKGKKFTVECTMESIQCARSLEMVGGRIQIEQATVEKIREER